MKKVAFFVEGSTELTFLVRLLQNILTENQFVIEMRSMRGSGRDITSLNINRIGVIDENKRVFILVTDCGSDSTVKSYLLEERESLIKSGYSVLIGLQDLYPLAKDEYRRLRDGLYYKAPQVPIRVEFVIAVMEVEAWFIAEKSHFLRRDRRLTNEFIFENLNLDLSTVPAEDILRPAETLRSIYQLVGGGYSKRSKQVERIINDLDYAELYFNLSQTIPSLENMIGLINQYVVAD